MKMKTITLSLLCLLSMGAQAVEMNKLRSGGAYEANLIQKGMPIDGGLVWNGHMNEASKKTELMVKTGSLASGGQYEATLREKGVNLSTGLAWSQK